jgi:hypothetical protein
MKLSIEKLKELLPDATPDRRGKNLRAKCPFCGGDEFGISLEDNHLFGCYRKKKCGETGNIFTLAKLLNRWDILNIEGEVGRIEKLENALIKPGESYDLELPDVSMPVGWKRVYQDDYLDSRGFKEYERYKVGKTIIDPRLKKNYVITAIEENGKTNGYISRHIWDKKKIEAENKIRKTQGIPEIKRYLNSDTDFGKLLFGYDEIVPGETKTIICVEGIFDKWNIDRLMVLHHQNWVKCNATFKCAISPEQIIKWKLKGIERLVLFYDPDVIDMIKTAGAELQLYFDVMIAFNDEGDCDAGDIDDNGLHRVFSNLRSVSDFSSNKVASKIL